MVACGLPHYGRGGDLVLARREIAAAQQHFAGLRRYGAAALDLAWIAAGRLDAYWERDLSPWDLAAGLILVREAGGFVTDCDGGDAIFAKGEIAAGNDSMHGQLLRLIKEAAKAAAKDAQGRHQGARSAVTGFALTLPQRLWQFAVLEVSSCQVPSRASRVPSRMRQNDARQRFLLS